MKRLLILPILLATLTACDKPQEKTAPPQPPAATPAPSQPETPAPPQPPAPAAAEQPAQAPTQAPAPAPAPAAPEPAPKPAPPQAAPAPQTAQPAEDILALAKQSGCLACHDVAAQRMGPSFQAIAGKYRGQTDARKTLQTSIQQGSQGKWPGARGAMPGYKDKVADSDVKKLVDFILAQ